MKLIKLNKVEQALAKMGYRVAVARKKKLTKKHRTAISNGMRKRHKE